MTFSEIPFPKSEKPLGCKDFQSSATLAWEAVVLPIYESCGCGGIIAEPQGKCKGFLSPGARREELQITNYELQIIGGGRSAFVIVGATCVSPVAE